MVLVAEDCPHTTGQSNASLRRAQAASARPARRPSPTPQPDGRLIAGSILCGTCTDQRLAITRLLSIFIKIPFQPTCETVERHAIHRFLLLHSDRPRSWSRHRRDGLLGWWICHLAGVPAGDLESVSKQLFEEQ